MIPWPMDPKTKEKSVSLGLLVLSTMFVAAKFVLEMAGHPHELEGLSEWWLGTAALYFGRRYTTTKGSIEVTQS